MEIVTLIVSILSIVLSIYNIQVESLDKKRNMHLFWK